MHHFFIPKNRHFTAFLPLCFQSITKAPPATLFLSYLYKCPPGGYRAKKIRPSSYGPFLFSSTFNCRLSTHLSPHNPVFPFFGGFVYAKTMLDEKDFQRKADSAFEQLKKRLLTLGDQHGFDVEGESGKLEVLFEEPEEAKFVISPNTPVREIWISALSTSFKLGWNESRNSFVLEKTGEDLYAVMSRVVSQQLGTEVKV